MKILFLVNDFYPASSASSSIIMSLAEFMIRKNHQVDVLCLKDKYTDPDKGSYQDINIARITDFTFFSKKHIAELGRCPELKYWEKSYVKTKHLIARIISRIQLKITGDDILRSRARLYSRYLLRQIKANNYSAVISINAELSSALAAIEVKRKLPDMKYVFYQVDPFTDDYELDSRFGRSRAKIAQRIFAGADRIITSPSIMPEIDFLGLSQYGDKISVSEFPKIRELQYEKCGDEVYLDQKYINLVYTGILYPDIRKPDYCLALLSRIDLPELRIYFVGCRIPAGNQEAMDKLGDRLIVVDRVSQQAVVNLMLQADFLMNIGNTITNTVPSKIFDYIAACRPIVNFYKKTDCPTLMYTKRYPVCLDIYEDYAAFDDNLGSLQRFISNHGKEMDFPQIKRIYNDCTVEYVGEKFETVILNLSAH